MRKFCCTHCGNRLAVQPRHLSRLVACPECGRMTHPLAGEFLASATPCRPASSTQTSSLPCANCGRSLGKLQKRHLWRNELVCTACRDELAGETALAIARPAEPIPADRTARRASGDATTLPALPIRGGLVAARAVSAGLRVVPLQWRQRAIVLLAAVCVAGVALYGALSLLRELTGLLTTAALVVLIAAAGFLLLRLLLSAGRDVLRVGSFRIFARRGTVRAKRVGAIVIDPGEPDDPTNRTA